MSHDGHQHDTSQKLKVAFLLNLAFVVLELGGGFWTNSIAILTDALHDAGDCFSLGLAWYLQKLSTKRPDAKFTYGYQRFSSLGALITGSVLMVGLLFIVWQAIQRMNQPAEVHVPGMFGIAVAGIVLNGAAAWKLHGGHSPNETMAGWHLLEDTLGWVAVLLGSVVMLFWRLPIIDPLLALLISSLVLWNVFKHMKRVMLILLQSVPAGFDSESLDHALRQIPGVVGSHHTHTWTLDGETHVFSTHLVMRRQSERQDVVAAKQRVHDLLAQQEFEHITVEVELEDEWCATNRGGGVAPQ